MTNQNVVIRTQAELIEKLREEEIPENRYSLDGGIFHKRLCLECRDNKWFVYYCKNKKNSDRYHPVIEKLNEKWFEDASQAYTYFYHEIINIVKYPRSKGNETSKKPGSEYSGNHMTKYNEYILNIGNKILKSMSKEERLFLGSKSGTLRFVNLLGLASKKSRRNIGGVKNREEKSCSTPVGITLISDEDISVPEIDVTLDIYTGIDPEKDIKSRNVKAFEPFVLTYYEFMFLIIRDEYAGFFKVKDDEKGGYFTVNWTKFRQGKAKLPTPTIHFKKQHGAIKAEIIDIDIEGPNGWELRPEYVDKFGKLFNKLVKRGKKYYT
jgi:hypothetical protein